MSDIIEQLSSQFGLGREQVEGAVGGLLKLVQEHVPAADFAQLQAKLPNAQGLMDKAGQVAGSAQSAGGGLLGQAANLLGSAGQGGIAALLGQLGKSGISADTAMQMLPALLEKLKGIVGPELVESITSKVPGLKDGLGGAGGLLGGLGGLLK